MKLGLVAAILVALAAAPAFAQPADPAAEERARVLYEKGTKHYDLAEYDEAIAAFKDAYKELKEPLFLYNIAQAYRQKRDCVNAVKFYKTYLRGESEGATADQARTFVSELEACAKEQETAMGTGTGAGGGGTGTGTGDGGKGMGTGDEGKGTGTGDGGPGARSGEGATGTGTGEGGAGTGHGAGVGVRTVVTIDNGKTKRLVGMGIGGAGVLLVGLGVLQGMKARDTADELASRCSVADPCEPDQWRAIHDRGQAQQTNQVFGIGVGTVAIAAGVGLYMWGRASRAERTTIGIAPARDGAAATLHLRF